MAAPSILWVNRATSVTLLRLDGGVTTTQIGGIVGAAEALDSRWKNNYAIQFRGRLYVSTGTGTAGTVSRYDEQTGAWAQVFTSGVITGGTTATHGGLTIHTIAGVPTLVFTYGGGTATNGAWAKTTDGTTWTPATISTLSTDGDWGCFPFRNSVYLSSSSARISAIEVASGVHTQYNVAAMAAPTQAGGNFCAFRNRLFYLRYPASGAMTLWELTGGTWISRGTLDGASTTPSATARSNTHHTLFAVGNTKMVAVYINSDGTLHGSKACDITPSGATAFTFLDITSGFIPTNLDPEATTSFQEHGWTSYVDNETTPGTPVAYLWHMSDINAGTYTYFEYVNSTTLLAPGSSGPSTAVVPTSSPQGGGERAWISGQLGAELTGVVVSTTLGQIKFSARAWGDTVYGPGSGTESGGRRAEVRLATTAALPANTPAGAGVGKTLTGNVNAALSIDTTLTVVLDRVLIKNEVADQHNGLYSVTQVGDGSNPFILTRVTDFDAASITEVAAGAWVKVTAGPTNINTYWQMNQTAAITVDTTTLTWAALTPRVLRLRYNSLENTNLSQATLIGAITGLQPQAIRVGSEIQQVIADGVSTVSYEWAPTTDGVANNSQVVFCQEVAVS